MKEHDPLDLKGQEREKDDRATRDRIDRQNEKEIETMVCAPLTLFTLSAQSFTQR